MARATPGSAPTGKYIRCIGRDVHNFTPHNGVGIGSSVHSQHETSAGCVVAKGRAERMVQIGVCQNIIMSLGQIFAAG